MKQIVTKVCVDGEVDESCCRTQSTGLKGRPNQFCDSSVEIFTVRHPSFGWDKLCARLQKKRINLQGENTRKVEHAGSYHEIGDHARTQIQLVTVDQREDMRDDWREKRRLRRIDSGSLQTILNYWGTPPGKWRLRTHMHSTETLGRDRHTVFNFTLEMIPILAWVKES